MTIQVFIECEAGSDQKNVFDEKTLELKESFTVSRSYPYPYGFIQRTKSGDGDCLDCFIITDQPLKVGTMVEAEVVGIMEQHETRNGVTIEDHNILAGLPDTSTEITPDIRQTLTEFVSHVWDHRIGKKVTVGRFANAAEAMRLIEEVED